MCNKTLTLTTKRKWKMKLTKAIKMVQLNNNDNVSHKVHSINQLLSGHYCLVIINDVDVTNFKWFPFRKHIVLFLYLHVWMRN